jgi:protocatechuate 3,4-dioxygenase beta subunit
MHGQTIARIIRPWEREERTMKPNTISLRRRHLMIAGLAGVATPHALFAGQITFDAPTASRIDAYRSGDKLIVSGRIVDANGKAVADARIEVLHAQAGARSSVATDADGRFMLTTIAPETRQIEYRVSHKDHPTRATRLHLAPNRGVRDDVIARLQRDDAGVWRTTFALTLA